MLEHSKDIPTHECNSRVRDVLTDTFNIFTLEECSCDWSDDLRGSSESLDESMTEISPESSGIEVIREFTALQMGGCGLNEGGGRLDHLPGTLEETLDRVPGQCLGLMIAVGRRYRSCKVREWQSRLTDGQRSRRERMGFPIAEPKRERQWQGGRG